MMIRELIQSDLPALLALYAYLHATDDPLPSQDEVRAVWDTIQQNPNLKYLGGFDNDTLVSSCALNVIPNLTRGCRPYGVIENVVTHPEFRRQGFGKAVLEQALANAWSMDCYKVMLLTGRKDEGTYRFYESAGFDRNAKQAFLAKPPKAQSGSRGFLSPSPNTTPAKTGSTTGMRVRTRRFTESIPPFGGSNE